MAQLVLAPAKMEDPGPGALRSRAGQTGVAPVMFSSWPLRWVTHLAGQLDKQRCPRSVIMGFKLNQRLRPWPQQAAADTTSASQSLSQLRLAFSPIFRNYEIRNGGMWFVDSKLRQSSVG